MTLREKVAKAIDGVQLFSRINMGTPSAVPGEAVEICRYGKDGEPEIVVLRRFATTADEREALSEVVSEQRALAAIEAMRADGETGSGSEK